MSLFKQFKTDPAKEIDGVKIYMPEAENEDGTIPEFTIARMGGTNKRYSRALESGTREHRRAIEKKLLSNEKAEEVFLTVFIDTILIGWANIQDAKGKLIEFNKANVRKLLEELPEVYERLQEEARLLDNFRADALEVEAKN
jgi:hypothetical protein